MITQRLEGDGFGIFLLRLRERVYPSLDNYNKNVASRLTKRSIQILDETRIRPKEEGWRRSKRLTGTLAGRHGRSRAITGEALRKGEGRQLTGVGWPDRQLLDRRARHWRRLEYGTGPFPMPLGLFLRGNKPSWGGGDPSTDRFVTYREYISGQRLTRGTTPLTERQRRARQRRVAPGWISALARRRTTFLVGQSGMTKRGIEAKQFIQRSWEEIVGPDGEIAFRKWIEIVETNFETLV